MEKKCCKCQSSKSLEEFYSNPNTTDRKHSWCIECCRSARLSRYVPSSVKPPPSATCTTCGEPNKLSSKGRRTKCKICRDRVWEENCRRRGLDPNELRASQHRRRAKLEGLIPDWKVPEDAVCQICGDQEKIVRQDGKKASLCIDHCHETGKVRGFLCRSCNTGLGGFRDRVDLLNQAISYLIVAQARV